MALAPNAIINVPMIDCSFRKIPTFSIIGVIIIKAGTNLKTKTSSTVRFPLTAKRVPIRKVAHIVTVAIAATIPAKYNFFSPNILNLPKLFTIGVKLFIGCKQY